MNINMNNLPTDSICQMEEFLKSNDFIEMEITSKKDRYEFIKEVLNKIHYRKLKKKEKMLVMKYLKFLTKYSKTQSEHPRQRRWLGKCYRPKGEPTNRSFYFNELPRGKPRGISQDC